MAGAGETEAAPRDQVRGKVSRETQGREEAREPVKWHTNGKGWNARGRGDREKEREKEEQLMPQSAGAQGGAYLPVILHVVAQADETGLELLRPQRPAVVLPGVRRQVCARGGVETRPARRGVRGQGHMQRAGGGEHIRGKHRVRGDMDKVMARDSGAGRGAWWPGGWSEACPMPRPEQGWELSSPPGFGVGDYTPPYLGQQGPGLPVRS